MAWRYYECGMTLEKKDGSCWHKPERSFVGEHLDPTDRQVAAYERCSATLAAHFWCGPPNPSALSMLAVGDRDARRRFFESNPQYRLPEHMGMLYVLAQRFPIADRHSGARENDTY